MFCQTVKYQQRVDKYFIPNTGFALVFSSHTIEKKIWLFGQSFLTIEKLIATYAEQCAG